MIYCFSPFLRSHRPTSVEVSLVRCPVETKHLTKEHVASCLSPQGTDRMNIQATHSPNRRHSEEQGESRFATPHGSSSRKGAKQPKPMDHLIDRPDCSKLVGTFNLFIPRCSQTGRAPKADFKPLFLFCSRSNWIRTSENLLIPNQALYHAELHSDMPLCLAAPLTARSPRGG